MNADPEAILSFLHAGVFFSVLFAGALTDAVQRRIPNGLCLAGALAGFFLAYVRGGFWPGGGEPVSLAESLAAAVLGFVLLALAWWTGGMGAGDVKLLAALGALSNVRFLLWTLFHGALAGLPLAVGFLAWRRELRPGLRGALRALVTFRRPPPAASAPGEAAPEAKAPGRATMPYAVALCLGGLWTAAWFLHRGMPLPFG